MLLLCCIVYLCIVVCSCIVYFSYSGMEERLCQMPELKLINQIKSNHVGATLYYYNLRYVTTCIPVSLPHLKLISSITPTVVDSTEVLL